MTTTRARIRTLTAAAALAAAVLVLAACVPEPASTSSPSSPSSPTATGGGAPTATGEPTVDATEAPTDRPQVTEISLPASCEALYSAQMRATLDASLPPLNDPGVTLASTDVASALGLLESGVPTLRCSWGTPSENGLSTNVSILAVDDVPRLQDVLAAAGFTCADAVGGILCTSSGGDGRGESHFLRGNGWVATAWIGALPDGYTEDIAATLWG
ncbi:hypothetical protein [Microbacterium sp. 18062]|uniref:hypothetical protein n=1 Tax=Microbacterium sp. 18062 TaxID=2681410 RepID=UPI00135ACF96|nr:hypothetical protein [Microbacterium sp. 18062]